MNISKVTKESIQKAAGLIKSGELVAFPTETVYGLGADGLNPDAVARIFEVKERPSFNPLILHIGDKDQLENICIVTSEIILKLIDKFWPGPLTLVIPKKSIVPDIVTSGNETVAIRMPDHPVALQLIKMSGRPIAAPSANVFGRLSPTKAGHVYEQLGSKIKMILDGGDCKVGVESTILQITCEGISLLRPGGLPVEQLEKITGKINTEYTDTKPVAPGMLPYHYAPKVPIKFINEIKPEDLINKNTGALLFSENKYGYEFTSIKFLSKQGNLREAAANLFSYLHEFENENIDLIVAEPVPETGLGRAIMDRLKKAAERYT